MPLACGEDALKTLKHRRAVKWIVTAFGVMVIAAQVWLYYRQVYVPGLERLEWTNVMAVAGLRALTGIPVPMPEETVRYVIGQLRWAGLLVFWPIFPIVAVWGLGDFRGWQRGLGAILRVILFCVIVFALMDIEKIEESSRVSVVYVVDTSDSMTDEMISLAGDEVRRGLARRAEGVDVQVVAFDAEPRLVEIGADGVFSGFDRRIGGRKVSAGKETDIESALRFCYALFPENDVKRIILISDGNETRGDVLSEAARARAQGIRIDVLHLRAQVPGEVMIEDVEIRERERLHVGRPFEILVQVSASEAMEVDFAFFQNGARDEENSRKVMLGRGVNFVPVRTRADAPGDLALRFELLGIDPAKDRFSQNNVWRDRVEVQGKPRILYLEDDANAAVYLQRALAGYGQSSGQDFEVEVRPASGIPSSLKDLSRYAAVILGDVPREGSTGRANLTTSDMQRIESYVRRYGGGFIALGGDRAFAPGGYSGTPIEKILPVSFKSAPVRQQQSALIALLIDKSGSMENGGKLEIAKEAAKASVGALQPQDRVIVVGFDDAPYLVVAATRAVNRYSIYDKISRMQPSGGTDIRNALELAYLEMSMVSATAKHVILLSDGRSGYGGIDGLVREMARARITVSTVAMGNADTALLGRIAGLGRGRAYIARDASSVPRIFVEETNRVADRSIVEAPFVPRVGRMHAMISGVSLQTLLGYVSTQAKPGSMTILTAPDGAPVLSHWAVGEGRTTAFTSDAKNRWASPWIRQSGSFSRFWAQVVRATMKTDEDVQFEMGVARENERVRVSVDAVGESDEFLNGLDVEARIVGPDGETFSLALRQTAPGFYENAFEIGAYGTYEAHAVLERGGELVGNARKTFSYPHAAEYARADQNAGLLDAVARASGGKSDVPFLESADSGGEKIRTLVPVWPLFLWVALALFGLDVAVRRIRF